MPCRTRSGNELVKAREKRNVGYGIRQNFGRVIQERAVGKISAKTNRDKVSICVGNRVRVSALPFMLCKYRKTETLLYVNGYQLLMSVVKKH